jgi:hypothetical protein
MKSERNAKTIIRISDFEEDLSLKFDQSFKNIKIETDKNEEGNATGDQCFKFKANFHELVLMIKK